MAYTFAAVREATAIIVSKFADRLPGARPDKGFVRFPHQETHLTPKSSDFDRVGQPAGGGRKFSIAANSPIHDIAAELVDSVLLVLALAVGRTYIDSGASK